jgi:SAM-dependent methyltransferase
MTTNTYSSLWFQLFMPLQTEELTQKDVAFLSRQLSLPRYRRILDLCCGYGRHALQLAKLGYQVTGLDRDESVIAEARNRATEANQEIAYLIGDMRQVGALTGEFDAVINMWQSLSYFDEETNIDLLCQIHHKLTPGGRFIVDMYNPDYFEHHQGHKQQEINGIIVESNGYLQGNRWHSMLTYRDEHGECGRDHMEWQLFTSDEFCNLAAECGFAPSLICGWSEENIVLSPAIPRMQIVLEK